MADRLEGMDAHEGEVMAEPSFLIEDCVRRFFNGNALEKAPVIFEGDRSVIRRLLEDSQDIGLPEEVAMSIDYRLFKEEEKNKGSWDQLQFSYSDKGMGENRPMAEMHIALVDANRFALVHRYVAETYRGAHGLGTQLLGSVETFLYSLASQNQETVTLMMESGQPTVSRWAAKLGYEPATERDEGLVEEIAAHPNRFIERDQEDEADQLNKDPYLFRKDGRVDDADKPVRIMFSKDFAPGERVAAR